MAELRSEYEQLLYFSVPKLLHLYQDLMAPDSSPENVMHDVGFLFENTPSVQSQLKQTVQVSVGLSQLQEVSSLQVLMMRMMCKMSSWTRPSIY